MQCLACLTLPLRTLPPPRGSHPLAATLHVPPRHSPRSSLPRIMCARRILLFLVQILPSLSPNAFLRHSPSGARHAHIRPGQRIDEAPMRPQIFFSGSPPLVPKTESLAEAISELSAFPEARAWS